MSETLRAIEGLREHAMRQGTWGIEYGDDRFYADVLRVLATPPVPAGDEPPVVEVEGKDGVVHRVWATPPAPAEDERERLATLLWVSENNGSGASWPPRHGDDEMHFLLWADRLLAAGVRLTEGGNR